MSNDIVVLVIGQQARIYCSKPLLRRTKQEKCAINVSRIIIDFALKLPTYHHIAISIKRIV